jgi:SAM-dependent methyltransferase
VRENLLPLLRCPVCRARRSFALDPGERDEREVLDGTLRCRECGTVRPLRKGIVDLIHDPPEFVVREAAGLERFADTMRADGWDRERVLNLPHEPSGYWFVQATAMNQVLEQVALPPNSTILDVGSNTCWASAIFAEHGLRPIALDIATAEMQGLDTARWWFEDRGVYFERVLAMMFDLPFSDDAIDFAWCCEVLHHNHRANLYKTVRELFRVLRPGGTVIVVNEPLRSLAEPRLRPGHEVAEYEGHEHAYLRASYLHAMRRAGFRTDLLAPRIHGPLTEGPFSITREMSVLRGFRAAGAHAVRRNRLGTRAYLAARAYVAGGTTLWALGHKPD